MELNRGIFLSSGDVGSITTTYTLATGSTSVTTRAFLEDSSSTTERSLFVACADDDASTPTIKVEIALSFDGGSTWSDWTEIESASVVPKQIKISAYDKSWWIKNNGVKFKLTKSGAGAVTFTGGSWL